MSVKSTDVTEIAMSVLGPLQFSVNGVDVTPTAPKQMQVLALMALNEGQMVTSSSFVDELWAERPPRSAKTTLQTYILHLRKLMSKAFKHESTLGRDILLTRQGGYLLRLPMAPFDLRQFNELSTEGRIALSQGDPQRGSHLLRKALGVWRGPALVDVPTGSVLEPKVRGLQAQRQIALESRVEADLQVGRYDEAILDLVTLTAQQPLNENIHEQYMRALNLAGRRSEALGIFHQLRKNLMDELGLEPSQKLQQAQHVILSSASNAA
ncbi:AfsR/SARP family transcriptional regulator [Streptomyces sp. NRRL F-5630]|uniref:AfsR/SARP family transcriptional regulator n=1 Tax=Streptomyces sp. NRRL F-5630 TaxID=1463864 RepID=UPI0009964F9B|nr:AfsR/SARP family transcriptional regulator [Streptomyces sp. NRRL F-5630]